jgi:phosphatidate cytidylyltransferase
MISGIFFIPLLFYAILFSPSDLPFMIILNSIVVLGISEFYDIVEKGGYKVDRYLGILLGMACIIGMGIWPSWLHSPTLFFIDAVVIGCGLFFYMMRNQLRLRILMSIVGVVYIGWMLSHLGWIYALSNGRYYLMACFLMSWVCDFFAYLVGIIFGRHTLMPKVSPKKTIEGALGGLFGSVLVSILSRPFLLPEISLSQSLVVGLVVGIFSQIGDACESVLKRDFGIKDSGGLVPGHGGLLDVFDSLILSGPAMFYCLALCGR